ncbi:hypothetical protein B0H11DRAFT_1938591 [Mycena galericulata]|nr:hypothetical protein B0H11DRAFT_1938591 [Mycena galericulata]
MDPLSILSTVLSTSIAVSHWLDDLKSQETAILELKSSLSSITLVLHPLREKAASGTLDSQAGILACLQDLGECLDCARDHLQTWQESETRKTLGSLARRILAFLDPSQVLAMIKDDRVRINQSVATLTLAIQLAWLPGLPATAPVSPLDSIQNQEVKQFWRQMIGESGFGKVARGKYPGCIDFSAGRARFWSCYTLWLQPEYRVYLPLIRSTLVVSTPQADRLIVWIAEHLEKYASSIQYAESLGIKVVSFPSLAAVKSWMELNEAFVRAVADSHRLRFVSDAARNEGGMFNAAAGELLLRYIRGRSFASPCLIFGPTVATTAYVAAYSRAGSTSDVRIVWGYIKALADGVRDVDWVGFDARPGGLVGEIGPPASQIGPQCFIKPLLLYLLGTKPEQDQVHIDYAASLGITVVTLFSIDELKRYMDTNQVELRRMATTHRLRFITQNVRREGGSLVLSAGEDTMKHIRLQAFASPVLVLCNSSIASTRFVTMYGRAGSTTDARIVCGFVQALAAGIRDTEWVGFDTKRTV